MSEHLRLIRRSLENANRERLESQAWEMLRKLAKVEPCSLRDLMRTYGKQQKSLHKPVIDYLVNTGRVIQIDSGRLRMSDETKLALLELPSK